MTRFADCNSCAFQGVEPALCERCNDADQWENDDPQCDLRAASSKNVHRIVKLHDKKIKVEA